jgi:hypothetical protein
VRHCSGFSKAWASSRARLRAYHRGDVLVINAVFVISVRIGYSVSMGVT